MTATTPRYRWLFLPLVATLLAGIAWPTLTTVAQDATPEVDSEAVVAPLTTASVVPEDAPFYLAATLDRDSGQWQLAEDLIRRAGLGDLLDQAVEETASEMTPVEAQDLDTLLTGEVALVVADLDLITDAAGMALEPDDASTSSSTDSTTPAGFAVVFAPADPDAAETLATDSLAEEAAARGVEVEEIDEDGATVVVAPGDEFEEGAALARLGDILVFSATTLDISPFIEVFAGNETALAERDAFLEVRDALPNDFLVYGYANGTQLRMDIEEALASATEAGLGPAELQMIEQSLAGLDTFSGFTVWADDPGFRFDTIAIPADGADLPPVPANFDATLPERVPGDTVLLVNSYDLGATLGPQLDLMASILAQVAEEDPTFPVSFPPAATEEERAGAVWEFVTRFLAFNPRTDLVGQLVEEWGLALSVRPEDPTYVSGVFVSGVEDEIRVNDAVTKLAVWFNLLAVGLLSTVEGGEEILLGPDPVGASTEEVEGALTQIIQIPIPELDATIRMQWGVLDGEFVFGFGDGFGEYTAGPDGALSDNPRYQATMAELPAEHFATAYVDLGRLIELGMPILEEELGSDAQAPGSSTSNDVELPDLSAIQSLGVVGFEREGAVGTSAILLIAE